MHSAPPVVYPLGRSSFYGLSLLGFWLAGAWVLALWWRTAQDAGWRLWGTVVALMSAGVAAGWGWKNSPVGQLHWDSQVWQWEGQGPLSDTTALQLSVVLDFQRSMLLRLESPERVRMWLWASRGAMPERWLDLRRAVHSHGRAFPPALMASDPDAPPSGISLKSPSTGSNA